MSKRILRDGTLCFFYYDNQKVKDAIYYIKNKPCPELLHSICGVASKVIMEHLSVLNIDTPVIVAVPSSRKKFLERGFNPSEKIARELALSIPSLTLLENVLVKVKDTKPQKDLTRGQRLKNVSRSMSIRSKYKDIINGRYVIVVDDVVTTGATLEEARRALEEGGALQVLCVALAH